MRSSKVEPAHSYVFDVETSLFDGYYKYMINPVNCVGVMGAGLAYEFKRRYPSMFTEYVKACQSAELRIGSLLVWRNVICFPTKRHWKDVSRIGDIERGLQILNQHAKNDWIGMPSIGCGLGGLNWEKHILPAIHAYLPDTEIGHCTADVGVQKPLMDPRTRKALKGEARIWTMTEDYSL